MGKVFFSACLGGLAGVVLSLASTVDKCNDRMHKIIDDTSLTEESRHSALDFIKSNGSTPTLLYGIGSGLAFAAYATARKSEYSSQ